MWYYLALIEWTEGDNGVNLSNLPDVLSIVHFNGDKVDRQWSSRGTFPAYKYRDDIKTVADYGAEEWSNYYEEFMFSDADAFETLEGAQRNMLVRILTW